MVKTIDKIRAIFPRVVQMIIETAEYMPEGFHAIPVIIRGYFMRIESRSRTGRNSFRNRISRSRNGSRNRGFIICKLFTRMTVYRFLYCFCRFLYYFLYFFRREMLFTCRKECRAACGNIAFQVDRIRRGFRFRGYTFRRGHGFSFCRFRTRGNGFFRLIYSRRGYCIGNNAFRACMRVFAAFRLFCFRCFLVFGKILFRFLFHF